MAPKSDKEALEIIINALTHAGWELNYVYDGEEKIRVSDTESAIEAIWPVDAAYLFVKLPNTDTHGNVFFVLGNEPEEIANDWSECLNPTVSDLVQEWF